MKKNASIPQALLGLLLSFVLLFSSAFGCAKLQPGQDPVIVRCEQTQRAALIAFDEFLKFDSAHPELPQSVHSVANAIRDTAPSSLVALDVARRAYESTRSKENAAAVDKVLQSLDAQLKTVQSITK